MDSIGQQLKAARERKGVTASQAAAATHLKVQHVEALERDDYSRLTVPTYAKGFLKIYAEYLGLDSVPLIREYSQQHLPLTVASPVPGPATAPAGFTFTRLLHNLPAVPTLPAITPERLLRLLPGVAAILLVVVLIMALRHGCHRTAAQPPVAGTNALRAAAPTTPAVVPEQRTKIAPWVIVNEPPLPYYKRAAGTAATP